VDEVRAAGRTVFLSSHVLPEVERLADRVGIVRESRLVAVEAVEALKTKARRRLEILFAQPLETAPFTALPGVKDVTAAGPTVVFTVEGPLDALLRAASKHGIVNVRTHESDLESVFMAYYRDPGAA